MQAGMLGDTVVTKPDEREQSVQPAGREDWA